MVEAIIVAVAVVMAVLVAVIVAEEVRPVAFEKSIIIRMLE